MVTLPPLAVEALGAIKAQAKARFAVGPAWQDHGDLVFSRPDGRPLDPSTISKGFADLARAAKLPRDPAP